MSHSCFSPVRFLSHSGLVAALLLAVAVVAAPTAQAQTTETYDVSGFSTLEMSVRGTAYVSQGDTESLEITGPADVVEDIEARVSGGTLVIEYAQENWIERFFSGDRDKVEVRVTMSTVEGFMVDGAGSIVGETPLEGNEMRLDISGAGDMELDLRASDIRTQISGAGEMTLAGSASSHRIQISGAGEIDAADLETADTEITVSGAGECRVHATNTLDVTVSGAGSVRYKGQPKVTQSVSGAGSVESL